MPTRAVDDARGEQVAVPPASSEDVHGLISLCEAQAQAWTSMEKELISEIDDLRRELDEAYFALPAHPSAPTLEDEHLKQVADAILVQLPQGTLRNSLVRTLSRQIADAFIETGQVLLAAGQLDLAEQLYRSMVDRPNGGVWAVLGLTAVAERRGNAAAIASAWSECLRRYPFLAEPAWFARLARAERARNDHIAAERYLRQGIERFPQSELLNADLAALLLAASRNHESHQAAAAAHCKVSGDEMAIENPGARSPDNSYALARQAQLAARRGDWSGACELWTRCVNSNIEKAPPAWRYGLGKALFRLWRAEEALETWRDLICRFPDYVEAYVDFANTNQKMGRWHTAYETWNELICRQPDPKQYWYVRRVKCLLDGPDTHSIEVAICNFEARFPQSSQGQLLAIDLAYKKMVGLAELLVLVEHASARYPNSRELLSRHDEEQTRESAQRVVPGRSWTLEAGCAICEYFRSIGTAWATELALSLSESLDKVSPGEISVLCERARLLIEMRRYGDSLALINMVPEIYQGQEIRELRDWAVMRRGATEASRGGKGAVAPRQPSGRTIERF